ncbi:hypothetical protein MRX96_037544 [Rhipicephalus microplus]
MDVKEAGQTSEPACMQAAAESLTSAKETDVLNDATAATDESETSTQTVQEPAEGGAMEWHDAEEPGVGGKRPRDAASTEPSDMSNQEPPPKAALLRRQRLAVKHNITEGEKRTGKPAS